MTEDEFASPDGEVLLVAPGGAIGDESAAEVTFIVPAPAYESIATDPASALPDLGTIPDEPDAPALEAIAALDRKLDALSTRFDREIRAEGTREKVVDRLHAELQDYKQGLILGILRPVFVDLIQLHDDMGKMIAATPELEGEAARLLTLIRGFQQGVEDILYRQGVEPFAEEAEGFDPRRQRALSTVSTDDPARNKQIAARLRPGFRSGDKVIRPEMVTVFAHKPRAPGPDPA